MKVGVDVGVNGRMMRVGVGWRGRMTHKGYGKVNITEDSEVKPAWQDLLGARVNSLRALIACKLSSDERDFCPI